MTYSVIIAILQSNKITKTHKKIYTYPIEMYVFYYAFNQNYYNLYYYLYSAIKNRNTIIKKCNM